MAKTEVNPGEGGKYQRMFSDEQIALVKAAIEADPRLARKLISSAQSGNEDDLRFILEAGIVFSGDMGEAGDLTLIEE